MLNKIKKSFLALSVSLALLVTVPVALPAATAYADSTITNGVCGGATDLTVDSSKTASDCANDKTATGSANTLITDVLQILSVVIGLVAVIMIMIGGFHYVTSGGSQEKVKKAKETLLYAIIGIIIVVLAQTIVKFVL